MTLHDDPTHLRRRAATLRALAARLDSVTAARLPALAGTETWRTPRADLCRHLLAANVTQLRHAVDQLRHDARGLDERAADLEVERVHSVVFGRQLP